jgi:hypothetical protein
MTVAARGSLAVVALLAALAATPGGGLAGESRATMSGTKGTLECVGRFCVSVPEGYARAGEKFRFGQVNLEEIALPDGERGFQALWTARLAKVAALRKAETREVDPTGRIRELMHLGPLFEAAMYHNSSMTEDGKMAGLLAREGKGLSLESVLSFVFRNDVVECFVDIHKAWHPRREGEPWPIPGKNAFYLGKSALAGPAYGGEEAYARFETSDQESKISVTTESQVEPEKKGIMESLGEAAARAGMGLSGVMKTVRSGSRKAGGEKGEELVARVDDGKELQFVWTFVGGEEDSNRPRIDIQMETSSANEKEKLVMWDRLLDSLRRADAK